MPGMRRISEMPELVAGTVRLGEDAKKEVPVLHGEDMPEELGLSLSLIGFFKPEVIRKRGPWRGLEDVEFATLDWVSCYNTQRLLESIGYVPPVEYEDHYCRHDPTHVMVAGESTKQASGKLGAVQR